MDGGVYNVDFVCTYQFHNESLAWINPFSRRFLMEKRAQNDPFEFDKGDEVVILSDTIYRQELTNAFQMREFDEKIVNEKIDKIYEWVRNTTEPVTLNNLDALLHTLAKSAMTQDLSIGFAMLFAYNYFHVTHLCIAELVQSHTISRENMDALKSCIK
jgi:hypothetical protein